MMPNAMEKNDTSFFGHPKPLKSLFFTELWERFSLYGIRPLLILYMSAMITTGGLGLDLPKAAAIVGIFAGSMYLVTLFGGWIADHWLGQAKSVWYGSILIALGHLSIALTAIFDASFFYYGLVLIVLGTGLFKTCISVIVGTLYAAQDSRRDAGFSIFYMGINTGAFFAPLIVGLLVKNYGWHIGFAVGGVGMLIALITFRFISVPALHRFNQLRGSENTWDHAVNYNPRAPYIVASFLALLIACIVSIQLGLIIINPVDIETYLTLIICITLFAYFAYLILFASTSRQDKKRITVCFILLVVAAFFWSSFEQQPTSFNLFAKDFTNRNILGFEIPTVWFQSINAIFIIIFAPVFAWLWFKLGKSGRDPSYISKFIYALVLTAAGFGLMMLASQTAISSETKLVTPFWLISTLLFLTFGELCISPVGLSTMTKLAPTIMRGQIMGLWFTSIAFGNLMAGLIGGHVSPEHIQELPTLFMRCMIALLICAGLLFLFKRPILKLINECEDHQTPTGNP